jgi:hypothetical protein
MSQFKLKATHTPVKTYYETLEKFAQGQFDNEGNVRRAFEELLTKCARPFEWFLVPEYQITPANPRSALTPPSSTPSTSLAPTGKPRTRTTTSPPKWTRSSPSHQHGFYGGSRSL